MHRHHPYAPPGYDDRGRRSASPGPRYPRNERGGPRGGSSGRGGFAPRGRGRGGGGPPYPGPAYSGYDNGPPGPPPPPPHAQYDSYSQPSYDQGPPYGGGGGYSGYGGPPPPPPPPPPAYGREPGGYDSYAQGYPPQQPYESEPWRGEEDRGGPPPPPRRRARDDKQHDAIIEDRINRERPCRTLFVRNIKYESDTALLRRQFEEHGQIRTFFDLISSRGMLFVTYYDLRAAQAARASLQGMEVTGRPIDVHYSLPRPEETEGRVDRDKHQGTVLVSLRDSGMPIDDNELRRHFSQFGDIKNIRPIPGRPDQRYVEMFDTRATEQVYDTLNHKALQDGMMELEWAWDILDEPVTDVAVPAARYRGEESYRDRAPRGAGRGRGGFHGGRGGRGGGGGGGGYDDYPPDRRDSRPDDYGRPPLPPREYDDDRYGPNRGGGGGGGGRGPFHGGASPAHANGGRGGGGYNTPDRQNSRDYGRPEQQPYNGGPVPPPPPQADHERLEQARKVQQLLAALKNPADAASVTQAQAQPGGGRPAFVPGPNASYNPNSSGNSFSTPPPPGPPGWNPPPPGAGPPSAYPPPAAATGATAPMGALPPAVLALLQQSAQQSGAPGGPAPPPPFFGGPPPPAAAFGASSSSGPTPPQGAGAPPQVQNPQAMQHLLALLAAQQKR